MGLFALLIVIGVVVVVATIVVGVRRMNSGEEMVAGGSDGTQLGHEDRSWGPTSRTNGSCFKRKARTDVLGTR